MDKNTTDTKIDISNITFDTISATKIKTFGFFPFIKDAPKNCMKNREMKKIKSKKKLRLMMMKLSH